MASDIEICNAALVSIGAEEIRAFDRTDKKERVCEVMYNHLLPLLLGSFNWSFARWIVQLRVNPDMPITEYGTAYDLPIDCLRPIDILPIGSHQSWEVFGSVVYTKVINPVLVYTRNITRSGALPPHFLAAFAAAIAGGIAPAIKDEKYAANMKKEAAIALVTAQDADARIGNTYKHPDTDPENSPFVNPDAATASGLLESFYVNAPTET